MKICIYIFIINYYFYEIFFIVNKYRKKILIYWSFVVYVYNFSIWELRFFKIGRVQKEGGWKERMVKKYGMFLKRSIIF